MSRIDGRGGKMYSFCAMNSLRMSFWIVPDSVCQSAPCCSATTRYIAKIIAAGELIVIDVVMSPSEMPSNSVSMSASDVDADAALPHFAERQLVVGIAAHQRRQIERDAQAGAAGREQRLVALVGLLRRAEPGKLPHRPELAAVAGRVNAARVGERRPDRRGRGVVDRRDVLGGVEALDRPAGNRREAAPRARATSSAPARSVVMLPLCLAAIGDGRRYA